MKRRTIYLGVLGIVTALVAGLVWLLTTESGLVQLVKLTELASKQRLQITGPHGTAWGTLAIDELIYTDERVILTIKQMQLAWSPSALLKRTVHAASLTARELSITTMPTAEPSTPIVLPELKLPVTLIADNIAIEQIQWHDSTKAEPNVNIEQFAAAGKWNSDGIYLDKVQLNPTRGASLSLTGQLLPQQSYPMKIDAQWSWAGPNGVQFEGLTNVHGDLARLNIQQQLIAPTSAIMTTQFDDVLRDLTWQAQLVLPKHTLQKWSSQAPEMSADISLELSGTAQTAQLLGHVALQRDTHHVRSQLQARWEQQRLVMDGTELFWPGLNRPLAVAGRINTIAPYNADMRLVWKDVSGEVSPGWNLQGHDGTLSFIGTINKYTAKLNAAGSINKEVANATASAHGNRAVLHLDAANIQYGARNLQADGRIALANEFDYEAYLNWKKLGWPLHQPQYQSNSGRAHVAGDRAHAVLGAQLALSGPQLPEGDWQIGGVATPDNLHVAHLEGQTRGGNVIAQGDITLKPELRIRADVNGEQINLERWLAQVPSRLKLRGTIDGRIPSGSAQEWRIQAEHISGSVRGAPAQAHGEATFNSGEWLLDPLVMSVGAAHAVAQGQIGTNSNLAWTVSIPNLAHIDKQWSGALDSKGSFTGEMRQPALRGWLRGKQLKAAGFSAQRLEAEADIDFQSKSEHNSTLKVQIEKITGHDFVIDEMTAGLTGKRANHAIAFRMAGSEGHLSAAISAGFEHDEWNATFSQAEFATPDIGVWSSASPGHLRWNSTELNLAKWCWSGDMGQFCGSGSRSASGAWQTHINAPQVALALLQPWLPGTTTFKGSVSVAAAVQQDPNQPPTGAIAVVANEGKIRLSTRDRQPLSLSYENFMASAKLLPSGISIQASGNVRDTGELKAEIQLPPFPWTQTWQHTPLMAHATASIRRFDWISAIEPAIEQAQGVVSVDITASGPISAPNLSGHAALDHASFRVAALGTRVSDLKARVEASGDQGVTVTAKSRMGEGSLGIDGTITWDENIQRVIVNLTGDTARIMDTSDIQVDISPDLQFVLTPQMAAVNGTVAIPHADVVIKSVSSRVKPSPDVVIVDAPVTEKRARAPKLSSIVRIDLGEDVKFEGFGLRARMEGSVAIMDTPEYLASGVGELRIVSGQYEPPLLLDWLSGPKLSVKNGRLVFVGGPVDDPALNLRASRKLGEIEAGFNVGGTLREPQVAVYSIPSMSETDALSYVLLGRPTRQNSSQENSMVDSTSASLTIAGSEFLAEALRKPLGVEDVSVEQDALGRTSLQLGRYVSSRLYVSYGVGLAENVNTLRMRYKLSSSWSLEAETASTFSAADLLYTLESH